jgi:hypothetical protein
MGRAGCFHAWLGVQGISGPWGGGTPGQGHLAVLPGVVVLFGGRAASFPGPPWSRKECLEKIMHLRVFPGLSLALAGFRA